jgi:L-lactate dehydrogenase complex protein LldG
MGASRDNILRKVRAALGNPSPASRQTSAQEKFASPQRGPMPKMEWDWITRFKQRCIELSSTFDEVDSVREVPAAIARYLQSQELTGTICCWERYADLPWSSAGVQVEFRPSSADDTIGITGCYCAISDTGTLIMLSGESTPLTPSLLPDTHIAIVSRSRVLACMEDAWDLLRREHGTLPRQVALVSGPSRTADIEMTMVLGIHGPYRVHLVLVQNS